MLFRSRGRHLSYAMTTFAISPTFRSDTGFVQRTDQRRLAGNVAYRWWPEQTLVNWGTQVDYGRTYDFANVLQDKNAGLRVDVNFVHNVLIHAEVRRDMERFGGVEFFKTGYGWGGGVSTSRHLALGGWVGVGDQVFYDPQAPYLGRGTTYGFYFTVRPSHRLSSDISVQRSRFVGAVASRSEIGRAHV